MFGQPHIDLFDMRRDATGACFSSSGSHGLETGCLSASMRQSRGICLFPFHSAMSDIVKSDAFDMVLLDSSQAFLASKGTARKSLSASCGRTPRAPLAVEASGSTPCQEV